MTHYYTVNIDLQTYISRGVNINDLKLEMIKQGWFSMDKIGSIWGILCDDVGIIDAKLQGLLLKLTPWS